MSWLTCLLIEQIAKEVVNPWTSTWGYESLVDLRLFRIDIQRRRGGNGQYPLCSIHSRLVDRDQRKQDNTTQIRR